MLKPKVCVLRSAGTNCDNETASAFLLAGADIKLVHINSLVSKEIILNDFHILALSGGFSYGDDVASGRILANELRFKLVEDLRRFINAGKLIIGICNGFQILVKSGLLPGGIDLKQNTSLITNDSGKFEDRWVYLRSVGRCIWTKNLKQIIHLPVAHGEGKFITQDKDTLKNLKINKQIVFQYSDLDGELSGYPDNPNGSLENIAGITDLTGRILGLMPHPERHIFSVQHPRWTAELASRHGDGLGIFKNGVDFIKENF